MDRRLIERYRFFRKHAGYVVGKCAGGALELAKAETIGERSPLVRFEWAPDDLTDGPESWGWPEKDVKRFYQSDHSVEACTLYIDNEPTESLFGIWDADSNYRRVIEAELLTQYLHNTSGEYVTVGNVWYPKQLQFPGTIVCQ